MDVTDYLGMYQMSATELADIMMADVLASTGITATCGIGTNMYLAKKADGSSKYTLAEMMSVSGHKTESQFRKYIKCSLDEYAERVAAANDKDGDNLF